MNLFASTTLSLGLAIAVAAMAPASAQAQITRDPAKIEAGTYVVDPYHTQVGFGVVHLGISVYRGTFSGASGTLSLQPTSPGSSSLKISVPVTSIMTTSEKLTGELKGDQWLDAAKYPDMTFTSTKVALTGTDRAKVTGDLTLHGVTKPVVLDVTLVGAGANPISKKYNVGFEADGEIQRSDFGVKTYVPMISDTVHLFISGAFERKE